MSQKAPDTSKASQIQADASIEAARIQAASEAENRLLQERVYEQNRQDVLSDQTYNRDITKQNQGNYQPYIDAGQLGLAQLSSQTLDPNSTFNQSFTGQNLTQDPGYQFRENKGNDALNKSLAAGAGLLSGAALKSTAEFNSGLASEEYNNAYSRFTNDKNNRYQALSSLAGLGLSGASGFAGGSPASTSGAQLANISQQYGTNLGNIIQNGANNQSNNVLTTAKNQAELAQLANSRTGGNFLGGAMAGATIGTKAMPGWGTAIGGVLGGLSSLL